MMLSKLPIILLASLLLTTQFAQAAKELVFLAEIGTHGHSYFPLQSRFNSILLTTEPIEDYEAKNITQLGIRQQYLIGQELRRRYITDPQIGTNLTTNQTFLNFSYRIQEVFTRTSGNAQSYISANAQLVGLYPPETCNQHISEWQKLNVRPPLFEGFTQQEINDIGNFATKGGFTPFDIFNQYDTEDQLNDRDGIGCPRYRAIRSLLQNSAEYSQLKSNISAILNPLIKNITAVDLLTYEDGLEFCKFVYDAWIDGYDFKTFSYQPDLQSACLKYIKSEAYYMLYGHKDLHLLKVTELTQLVITRLLTIPDQTLVNADPIRSQEYTWMYSHHGFEMKFNNLNKISDHKLFLLMGESWNTKAFVSLVTDDLKWEQVPPSSIVLIEAYKEDVLDATTNTTSIKATIRVKYNDILLKIKGKCLNQTECDILDFVDTIRDQGVLLGQEMRPICNEIATVSALNYTLVNPQELLDLLFPPVVVAPQVV